jgi:hypothetical protein
LGHTVFYYPEESRDGYDWRNEIQKKIEECNFFLLIATKEAIYSGEVNGEVAQAIRQQKRIIPCKHEKVQWSDLETLSIYSIRGPEFRNEYELTRKLPEFNVEPDQYEPPSISPSGDEDNVDEPEEEQYEPPSISPSGDEDNVDEPEEEQYEPPSISPSGDEDYEDDSDSEEQQ